MSTPTVSPYSSWGKRLGVTFAWLLLAIVFGVTGWFFAIKPLVTTLGNWNVARDYQPVEATIVERTARERLGMDLPEGTRTQIVELNGMINASVAGAQ